MRTLLALSLAVLLAGCATFKRPDGSLDVLAILNDAEWGISEACSVQWLSPTDCVLAHDAITIADGIVAKNVPMVGQAVRMALVDFDNRLPATSRVRAYIEAVIVLLAP